jgi:hypothetical protein
VSCVKRHEVRCPPLLTPSWRPRLPGNPPATPCYAPPPPPFPSRGSPHHPCWCGLLIGGGQQQPLVREVSCLRQQ